MRSIFKYLTILSGIILLTGCLHEKYGDCLEDETPDLNVTLEFTLPDKAGQCVFSSYVSLVDLAIYNESGELIHTESVSNTQLSEFKGVHMTLPAGTYYVAGWGNIEDNTKYEDVVHPYGAHVTYGNINNGKVGNADKVYYAPSDGVSVRNGDMSECYLMVVDKKTGHHGVLEFTEAHRIVNIYVEGYQGIPDLELSGVLEGLTWLGMSELTDDSGSRLTLTALQTSVQEEKKGVLYDYASFDTFRFNEDNEVVINLVDRTTGVLVFSVPLNEALEDYEDTTEIELSILIRFTEGGIEVTIPDWIRQELDPGVEV